MASKHTPGPWHVSEINASGELDEFHIFIEPNVAVIERKVAGSDECDMPDAHLIAAAPELLAALESILYCCEEDHAARDYCSRQTEIRGIARAAIAKAEGQQ